MILLLRGSKLRSNPKRRAETSAPAECFRHGGFADKHVAPAADLARIPDGLGFSLGALATDAGMTSYHAMVKRGGSPLTTPKSASTTSGTASSDSQLAR
jgi:D-arabinose 1-dehydrogenase-like Zn-dependent alcohol dehydrogenase